LLESVEGAMQKSPLRLAIARCDDRPQPTASLRERSFTQRKLIWREAYRLPQSNRSPNLTPIEIMQKQPIATAASPSTPRETRVMFLAIVVLLIAGVVAYHNCFSAPFLFDDDPSIADNPTIRKLWPPWEALSPPATGASVTSRPVVNYSFAINYAFGGLDVRGYHAVNLAIHLCAALALFGIIRRTLQQSVLGSRFGNHARPIAFVAALLWMLHPLQTESVVCVAPRTESLMGLFYLLTMYAAIRAMDSPRPLRWQILAFVTCLAGMATKEVMVSAPLIVLLYDRTFVAGTFREAWNRRKWSYLSLGATWILLTWLVVRGGNRGGTSGFASDITWWQYLFTQAEGIVRYLKLCFWPHPLVVDYGIYIARNPAVIVLCMLFLTTLGVATVVALWRRPVWGFAGVWFFAILAPSSSVLPVTTQTLAERRMYLPLAAVITLVVVGLHGLIGRRWLIAATVLAVVFGVLTIRRNADYRSDLSIWTDTVAKCPDNARALGGLGGALLHAGRAAEAIQCYERALQLNPKLPDYGLGAALLQVGRAAEVIPIYERALRLDPNLADVCSDLGNALADVGRVPEAIQYYERALRLEPNHPEAHNNLGAVLYALGRMQEAIQHYQRALQIRPDYPEAEFNLGLALFNTGRLEEAVAAFRAVVQRNPGLVAAWCSLGHALERSGRTEEAAASFEEALRRAPDSTEARDGLARLRAAPR
jgi:tetratricopeptide (TPR) repeat protein